MWRPEATSPCFDYHQHISLLYIRKRTSGVSYYYISRIIFFYTYKNIFYWSAYESANKFPSHLRNTNIDNDVILANAPHLALSVSEITL